MENKPDKTTNDNESKSDMDDKLDIPGGVFTSRDADGNGVRRRISHRAINAALAQLVVASLFLIRNSQSIAGGHCDYRGHFRH
jgi:hypothetical protein